SPVARTEQENRLNQIVYRGCIRIPHRYCHNPSFLQEGLAVPVMDADCRALGRAQKSPVMFPSSFTSIFRAEGSRGRPGIVMMSPAMTTTKPAPADSRTSLTSMMWSVGAPRRLPSVLSERSEERRVGRAGRGESGQGE